MLLEWVVLSFPTVNVRFADKASGIIRSRGSWRKIKPSFGELNMTLEDCRKDPNDSSLTSAGAGLLCGHFNRLPTFEFEALFFFPVCVTLNDARRDAKMSMMTDFERKALVFLCSQIKVRRTNLEGLLLPSLNVDDEMFTFGT